jgi:hypothetical protein
MLTKSREKINSISNKMSFHSFCSENFLKSVNGHASKIQTLLSNGLCGICMSNYSLQLLKASWGSNAVKIQKDVILTLKEQCKRLLQSI